MLEDRPALLSFLREYGGNLDISDVFLFPLEGTEMRSKGGIVGVTYLVVLDGGVSYLARSNDISATWLLFSESLCTSYSSFTPL